MLDEVGRLDDVEAVHRLRVRGCTSFAREDAVLEVREGDGDGVADARPVRRVLGQVAHSVESDVADRLAGVMAGGLHGGFGDVAPLPLVVELVCDESS